MPLSTGGNLHEGSTDAGEWVNKNETLSSSTPVVSSVATATRNIIDGASSAASDKSPLATPPPPEPSCLNIRRDWYSTCATFVAGGVAGAASRTLTAPLDRVKIIVQEGHLVTESASIASRTSCRLQNPSLADVCRLIWADGGWTAFWRGNTVNCFKAGPEFAIVFTLRRYLSSLYEDCVAREEQRKKEFCERLEKQDRMSESIALRERAQRKAMIGLIEEVGTLSSAEMAEQASQRGRLMTLETSIFTPPFNQFLCLSHVPRLLVNCTIGAAAGLGAQSVLYPMEVVKTRICVARSSEYTGGVRGVVLEAYQRGGYGEFYRGFVPNMVGILVYRGLEMGLYSSVQQSIVRYRMQWHHKTREQAQLTTAEIGIVGMACSTVAQTVSYPLNVVRTRLQTQGINGRGSAYTGMMDCFHKTIQKHGVTALFSGLTANYLKAVPASACMFIVFEKMQHILIGVD